MPRCIWCLEDKPRLSKEHVIPEALGGNDLIIVESSTCEQCNNKFGRLDAALVKQFEIVRVMYGILGKRGQKPKISSWAAISSGYSERGEPIITLNGGPETIEADGKRLQPARASNGIEDVKLDLAVDGVGRIKFSQRFGEDRLFTRALFKIGLTLVARAFGAEIACGDAYNHIRNCVFGRSDARPRRFAMEQTHGYATISISNPYLRRGCEYPLFEVTILGFTFLLDLDPAQANLRQMQGVATASGRFLWVSPSL